MGDMTLIITGILCVLSSIGFFATSVIQTICKNKNLFVISLITLVIAVISGAIFANLV